MTLLEAVADDVIRHYGSRQVLVILINKIEAAGYDLFAQAERVRCWCCGN